MYFKLIGGQHAQDDKVYKKGDTVRSPLNLVKLFPNKFVKLDKVDKQDETHKSPKIPKSSLEKETATKPKKAKAKKVKAKPEPE